MRLRVRLFLLSAMLLASYIASAQTVNQRNNHSKNLESYWEFGLNLGFTQYYGDISNKGYFKKFSGETKFGTGFFGRKIFGELTGFGGNISYVRLASEKDKFANGSALNFRYEGSNVQIGVHGYLSFSNLFWGVEAARPVNFYGTLGLSYISWNGTVTNTQTGTVLIKNGNNAAGVSYKSGSVVIPFNLGLGIRLNDFLKLNLEGSLQTVFSDDIDYYRDGFKNDILLYTSVGVSYLFDHKAARKTKTRKPTGSEYDPEVIEYEFSNRKESPAPAERVLPALSLPEPKVLPKEQPVFVDYEFRVQVLAMSVKRIDVNALAKKYSIETPIIENTFNGLYRYSTGRFNSFREAEAYSKVIRAKGVADAFVVAYKGNDRIPVTEAMKKR
ncbi:MAG: SPOR domain-containing protein [Bacteroidales bacterium]|nr:SPOR domain-containing protein [Bacteroidales bacterium]